MLVSFSSTPETLRVWLRVNKFNFEAYRDPEKEIYRAFGIGRSLTQGYNFKLLRDCASYRLKYSKGELDIKDDPDIVKEDGVILGGDVLINCSDKTLSKLNRSKTPLDRPYWHWMPRSA